MTVSDEEPLDFGVNSLPDELIIFIFRNLTLESILNCENVCLRWKKLARDPCIWRHIVMTYSENSNQTDSEKDKTLEIITTHADLIRCLKLQYVFSYPLIKTILGICDNLISLELIMCRIGKDFETDIKKWPNLRKINLSNSHRLVSDIDLTIHYDQYKLIGYIELSDFGLSSTNCNTLLNCAYLTHIFIGKIKSLSVGFIKELILSKQKILQALHIYGGDAVDDKCLCYISQCPLLKDLAIIRCENLTDEGLTKLSNLKNIDHMQIWNNSNFTEVNLMRTLGSASLRQLQSLSFSRIANVSPLTVDVISEYYKKLKFLALYQCPKIIDRDYEKQLKSKFRNIDVVLY